MLRFSCGIIHADIKPDNILISAGHNVVKICDLGSAMELTEVEPTPYLVSRFYRAPEIVLAAKYSFPLDVFAMGCTLFELFTGKILFPGKTNNDMLRLFMEVKGKLPNKLIKSGTVWKNHFDDNMDFKFFDVNKATRKKITRTITDLSAKRSVVEMICSVSIGWFLSGLSVYGYLFKNLRPWGPMQARPMPSVEKTSSACRESRTTSLPTIAEDEDNRANFSPGDLDSLEEDRLREPGA
eukprot:s544_g4.t2